MLSPSMMTKANGNAARKAVICALTSYCGGLPRPLSPMTANLTDASRFGSATTPRAMGGAPSGSTWRVAADGSLLAGEGDCSQPAASSNANRTRDPRFTDFHRLSLGVLKLCKTMPFQRGTELEV